MRQDTHYGWQVTVQPTEEPVTGAEFSEWTHLAGVEGQELVISRLLKSARLKAESYTRRQFCTATYLMNLDSFPQSVPKYPLGYVIYDPPLDSQVRKDHKMIRVYRPPLQSVTSITYYDENGSLQTLDPSLYIVDTNSEPGRLHPAPGTEWPKTQHDRRNAVQIEYVAGYGSATHVPDDVKQFIAAHASWFYDHRSGDKPLPDHIYGMLDSLRVGTLP